MTKPELISLCYNAGFAWKEGEHKDKKGMFIRCECNKCKKADAGTFLDYEVLSDLKWSSIYKHVIGGRHVSHVSRIVGYYSKIHNWNPSKIGELKDRQAGNYSLGGV